jgi:hypothetical protein
MRQKRGKPLVLALIACLEQELARVSAKATIAKVIRGGDAVLLRWRLHLFAKSLDC